MPVVLTRFFAFLAGILLCTCWTHTCYAIPVDYSTSSNDIPSQRQALLELYAAVGQGSLLGERTGGLDEAEVTGNGPWGSNTSYCSWWGVSCCGAQLRALPGICNQGMYSINTLQLAGTELNGTLPDIFGALPDLQLLGVGFNPALRGRLPPSLGQLQQLWILSALRTSMICNATTDPPSPPACPVPPWLMRTPYYYYERNGRLCQGITFKDPRPEAGQLGQLYAGAPDPEVTLSSRYFLRTACVEGPTVEEPEEEAPPNSLPAGVLVVIIVVPTVLLAAAFGFVGWALSRYVGALRTAHDALHLTPAWKRRNPPGVAAGHKDRLLRQVTLAETDVEGSTELMEGDPLLMTHCQEIHDNIMRWLISWFCGYEVTTEGDSFTVAFHEPFDAVAWALALQTALMEVDWPKQLLKHGVASRVTAEGDGFGAGQPVFHGLRVRAAINTGVPSVMYNHDITQGLMYEGPVVDLLGALKDLPSGGQVLLGPTTAAAIAPQLPELGRALVELVESPDWAKMLQALGGRSLVPPASGQGSTLLRSLTFRNHPAPSAASSRSSSAFPLQQHGSKMAGYFSRQHSGLGRHGVSSSPASVAAPAAGGGGAASKKPIASAGRRYAVSSVEDSTQGNSSSVTDESLSFMEAGKGFAGALHTAMSGKPSLGSLSLKPTPSAAGIPEVDSPSPILIDMGSHILEGVSAEDMAGLAGPLAPSIVGIRLAQIVTRALAPRALLLPPLKTARQVYPAYLDAPATKLALLPEGARFSCGYAPDVVMGFAAPAGLRDIETCDVRAARQALDMWRCVVRTTAAASGGYECQEREGVFMLAFQDAACAIEWSCLLQLALLRVHWALQVLQCPAAGQAVSPTGVLLYRGVRSKVGLYQGPVTRIIPHRFTGRADYFGAPVNRAARFLSAALPGQALAEAGLLRAAQALWQQRHQQIPQQQQQELQQQLSPGLPQQQQSPQQLSPHPQQLQQQQQPGSSGRTPPVLVVSEPVEAAAAPANPKVDGSARSGSACDTPFEGSYGAAAAAAAAAGGVSGAGAGCDSNAAPPEQQQAAVPWVMPGMQVTVGAQHQQQQQQGKAGDSPALVMAESADVSPGVYQDPDLDPDLDGNMDVDEALADFAVASQSSGLLHKLVLDEAGGSAAGANSPGRQSSIAALRHSSGSGRVRRRSWLMQRWMGAGSPRASSSDANGELLQPGTLLGPSLVAGGSSNNLQQLQQLSRQGSVVMGVPGSASGLMRSSSNVGWRLPGASGPSRLGGRVTSSITAAAPYPGWPSTNAVGVASGRQGASSGGSEALEGVGAAGSHAAVLPLEVSLDNNLPSVVSAPAATSSSSLLQSPAAAGRAMVPGQCLSRMGSTLPALPPMPPDMQQPAAAYGVLGTLQGLTSARSFVLDGLAGVAYAASTGSGGMGPTPAATPLAGGEHRQRRGSYRSSHDLRLTATLRHVRAADTDLASPSSYSTPRGQQLLMTTSLEADGAEGTGATPSLQTSAAGSPRAQAPSPAAAGGSLQPGVDATAAIAAAQGLPGVASTSSSGFTGALPLEALPELRLPKSEQQQLMAAALEMQAAHQEYMPLSLQAWTAGTWAFKGVPGEHEVVALLPASLASRMAGAAGAARSSKKARCIRPGQGLLLELEVWAANLDTLLVQPGLQE